MQLAPASASFFDDLDAFAPAREIYAQNTAIAARRVQELVRAAECPGRTLDAAFIGRGRHRNEIDPAGQPKTLTSFNDAAAYRVVADLIAAAAAAPAGQDVRPSR